MDHLLVASIRERYESVLKSMIAVSNMSGFSLPRLVVVTKSQPLEVVRAAVDAGISLLGENYAEEAAGKIASLGKTTVEWHMIGHIQSRKSIVVAENFAMVHSLDSIRLAARLNSVCEKLGRVMPVLLEINISGEDSKHGFPAWDQDSWVNLPSVVSEIFGYHYLKIRGLMTMPPFFDDPELARPYFQKMRRLQAFLKEETPQMDWGELSMGTSADYLVAVQEGATMVRVGQAILGPRHVHKEMG